MTCQENNECVKNLTSVRSVSLVIRTRKKSKKLNYFFNCGKAATLNMLCKKDIVAMQKMKLESNH
jgi:hypothetical protein